MKAIYDRPENGHELDRAEAKRLLKLGSAYQVADIQMHDWSTDVILHESPGKKWNSVLFALSNTDDEPPCLRPSTKIAESMLDAMAGNEGDLRWEIFTTDKKSEATPEETGYEEVRGPYNSEQEADDDLMGGKDLL